MRNFVYAWVVEQRAFLTTNKCWRACVRDLCTRGLLSIGRCQSPTGAGGPVCVNVLRVGCRA